MMHLTFAVLLSVIHLTLAQVASPIVPTTHGDVEGLRRFDRYGRLYDAFLGIPFAEPPLDELRWQKPQPNQPWEGVYEAKEFGPHCLQFVNGVYGIVGMSTNHSENCLYLNVYVPQGADFVGDPRPVMVYYYGGGFIFGTQEMYPPYHLANYGDVIVVNFDYRLSAVGFLSSGDAAAPGNYGLWDAHAVLTWVQNNIANFGGDPNRVTIFGQSAGGALVSLSTISPLMNGLFQGAIAMSGGATGFLGTGEYTRLMTQYLGDIFDCNSTDSAVIIDCLRQVDGEDLIFWGNFGGFPEQNISMVIRPVVDGELIVEDPRISYETGRNSHIHFITGNCKDDAGGTIVGNFFGLNINRTDGIGGAAETKEDVFETLQNSMGAAQNKDDLVSLVADTYTLLFDDDRQTRTLELSECVTDWHYAAPCHLEADAHSDATGAGRTYRYLFSYDQTFLEYPEWLNGSHTDDMYTLFGEAYLEIARIFFMFDDYEPMDLQVSNNMMTYFTNFAYTFDPNTGPRPAPSTWPEYDSTSRPYQVICPYPFTETLDDPVKIAKFDFWNNEFYDAAVEPTNTQSIRFRNTDSEIEAMVDKYMMELYSMYGEVWDEEQWDFVNLYAQEAMERRKTYGRRR